MRKLVFLLIAVFTISLANAQDAKKLLNEVSAKARSYENIQIDFKYNLNNVKENVNQETRGDVTMSVNKYLLNMLGTTRLFDGKKIYIECIGGYQNF